MKKIFSTVLALVFVVTLVACAPKKYTVTYDSKGGSDVESETVEKGKFATRPEDPTPPEDKLDYIFSGWFIDLESGAPFDFKTTPINSNITLNAKWTEKGKSNLNFDTKVAGQSIPSQTLVTNEGIPTVPANPTRPQFNFKGWYITKPGYSWNDLVAYDFTKPISGDTTVYAYWEPVNSKTANFSNDESYKVAMSVDSAHINPLTYTDAGQGSMIGMLSGSLYTKDIDWDTAIADGLATKEGDFSKFSTAKEEREYQISQLGYKYNTEMADGWPVDAAGDDHSFNGQIDLELAAQVKSISWTFKIKKGLIFENGDPINADAYEYTFKQYIDPIQLNSRSNGLIDGNYLNLKNAKAYLDGNATWADVGFEKIDDLTFRTTHSQEITQKQAMDMIDLPTLINKTAYEKGFVGGPNGERKNNNYGTPNNLFVSYGPYVIKEWSVNQKWVFNKNYDYVSKHEIIYKSYIYQVIENEDTREQWFARGDLNSFGLSANFFKKYANEESLLAEPDAYTMSLSFNNDARGDGKKVPSIVGNKDFRMAVFYGINRDEFALDAAAPDVPSLGLLSDMHLSAIENLQPYNKSKYHEDVLNDPELALSPETNGYLPNKAKELFDSAYTKWINEGNSGPVRLEFLSRAGSTYYNLMAKYIQNALQSLFGEDKIQITLNELSGDTYTTTIKSYNYDLAFNGMGGATHLGLFFTYAIYGNLNGPGSTFEPGFDLDQVPLELDYSEYYNSIKGKPAVALEDYEKMFLYGKADGVVDKNGDPIIVKPVGEDGIWKGTLVEFADFASMSIQDSSDYPMKHDLHYYSISVLEKAILNVMPTVPLTATANSTVFKNVNLEWPEFHMLFGWGAQKYRYLTTDPDFK